jgi:hypothetical protein
MTRRSVLVLPAIALVALTAAVAVAAQPARQAGPSFSGNGSKTLAPFRITSPSTLVWSNSGEIFQIFPKGLGGGSVNSAGHSGTTYVRAGSYQLTVNAIGTWRIRVVAGVQRPQSMGGGRVGYKGNGSCDLPPFTTRHGGQLVWTNSGQIFQIFSKDFSGGGDVNSQAHRGSTYLEAGSHELTLNVMGSWSLSWKP